MQAKFDKILIPIASELIPPNNSVMSPLMPFFQIPCSTRLPRTWLYEYDQWEGTVQAALRDQYTTLEEGKADILGLYLEAKLQEMGELDVNIMDEYTTFLAGIFRSIRFGASSAHGKANLIRFNYFKEKGAFSVMRKGNTV